MKSGIRVTMLDKNIEASNEVIQKFQLEEAWDFWEFIRGNNSMTTLKISL